MIIREAKASDLDDVLSVEREAFGSGEEANLVRALLEDPSARPALSLLAFRGGRAVGHILFTKARLEQQAPVSISLLAPLAVVPGSQKQGVGGALVTSGLQALSKSGRDLVFVLGHPEYYQRHGFAPAGKLGFSPPYPIPGDNADAWMVRVLRRGAAGAPGGRVICADSLSDPKYWRE